MENKFKIICQKDIVEVLEIINDYLPNLEKWHLEQSAIFEENKRIICRSIKDNNDTKLGYDIRIHINDIENTFFHFRYTNNCIFLIKKVWQKEKYLVKSISVLINNDEIHREVSIKDENRIIKHDEKYNINNDIELKTYFEAESLENIVNCLQNKHKVRKRN